MREGIVHAVHGLYNIGSMQSQLFVPDPSHYVPINPELKCGEEWADLDTSDEYEDEDGELPITFHITLPTNTNASDRLRFGCRDKSSGVLLPAEPKASINEEEERFANDPFFFERGFYLEAKTGFQIWPGSRLMIEASTCMQGSDRMQYWQERLVGGNLNILEVGAGVGVVGTCLAASGGKVLITDLSVLVEHGIWPNLRRNCNVAEIVTPSTNEASVFFSSLFEPTRIGEGLAFATVLDWFQPISEQLTQETCSSVDVIVACDCMFLRKLVDPLLTVVSSFFQQQYTRSPKFLFTFQRRNMMGRFIGIEELLQRIKDRGWNVECLAWRTIAVEGDGNHDLCLFEVSPSEPMESGLGKISS